MIEEASFWLEMENTSFLTCSYSVLTNEDEDDSVCYERFLFWLSHEQSVPGNSIGELYFTKRINTTSVDISLLVRKVKLHITRVPNPMPNVYHEL